MRIQGDKPVETLGGLCCSALSRLLFMAATVVLSVALAVYIAGERGPVGTTSIVSQSTTTTPGTCEACVDGLACWDLNGNGICDPSNEDKNSDGVCDALDCQGLRGFPGEDCQPCVNGTQGPQGIQGPAGPQGERGFNGSTGPQGPQGEVGPQGPQGPQGERGFNGSDGATGPAGPQGPQGEVGPAGPQGPQGERGFNGSTGPAGPQGPQGEVGPAGPQGPQGERGFNGSTGPQGPQGPQGEVGPAGPQGPQGERGFNGSDGATGPQGPQGEVGPAGPQGPPGVNGSDGATGPQGPQGPPGVNGTNGSPQDVCGTVCTEFLLGENSSSILWRTRFNGTTWELVRGTSTIVMTATGTGGTGITATTATATNLVSQPSSLAVAYRTRLVTPGGLSLLTHNARLAVSSYAADNVFTGHLAMQMWDRTFTFYSKAPDGSGSWSFLTTDIVALLNPTDGFRVVGHSSEGLVGADSYGSKGVFAVRPARGSYASPLNVNSGDELGGLEARAHDGFFYPTTPSASVTFVATENHSGAGRGTSLQLKTTPVGSTTAVTRVTVGADGTVVVDNTRATIELRDSGILARGRVFQAVAQSGSRVDVSSNLYYNGSHWMRDDNTTAGVVATVSPTGFQVHAAAAGNNPATLTNTLTVTPAGLVGIGTSTPTVALEVSNPTPGSGAGGIMQCTNPGSSPLGSSISLTTPGGDPGFVVIRGNGTGGSLRRYDLKVDASQSWVVRDSTAGADRLTLSSTGRLTTGPISVVGDANATSTVIDITVTGVTAKSRIFPAASAPGNRIDIGTNLFFNGTHWMRDDTGNVGTTFYLGASGLQYRYVAAGANPATLINGFRIDPSGNVYFGTDALGGVSTGEVRLGLSTTNTAFRAGQGASNNVYFAWVYHATPSSAYAEIGTWANSNPVRIGGSTLELTSGGTTRATISSGGNMCVGSITNCNNRLEVIGGGFRVQGGVSTTTTGEGFEISYSGGGLIRTFNRATNAYTELAIEGNPITFRSGTAGANRASFDASGHFVPAAHNTYDLGSSSLHWRNAYIGLSRYTGGLIELNEVQNGDRTTYIDFHASNSVDFSTRIIRYAGVNGGLDIYNLGTGTINFYTAGFTNLRFGTNNAIRMYIDPNGHLIPELTNQYNLGSTGNRWNAIWQASGAVTGSDRDLKENITTTPLGLNFLRLLRPVSYKLKNATVNETHRIPYNDSVTGEPSIREENVTIHQTYKRRHHGLIAQEVYDALTTLNVSTNDFAGYVDPAMSGEVGHKSLRYDEFISPAIKAIQELDQRTTPKEGVPASSTAPCNPGEQYYTTTYLFTCVAPNQWKRLRWDTEPW